MIDPQERWAQYGEKPDYLGLLTFSGTVYTEDPAELEGFDVAIVGAPMDDLVSDRPGGARARGGRRARSAPRALRPARTWRPRSTRSPSCGSSTSATRR
jgi:arginase family enzyme